MTNFCINYYFTMIKNIPLVKTKTKKRVKNPRITKGILRSIHIRNRLFKLTKTNPSVINLNKYKRYRNKLTSVIRLARKTYYSNEMNKNKNNTNSVWKLINIHSSEKIAKLTIPTPFVTTTYSILIQRKYVTLLMIILPT